ncbi:MAG: hypothetical protein GX149_03190 [Acholeplasmataceae bacterium]|jgi:uncharacterized membrane protein HdeD (DUF308 family)|nr:hypothetical protein [Acholeplasmataceae bacterium]
MVKKQTYNSILATTLAIVGLLLISYPREMLQAAVIFGGILFLAIGLLQVLNYLFLGKKDSQELINSLIKIGLGIVLLVFAGFVVETIKVFAIIFTAMFIINTLYRFIISLFEKGKLAEKIAYIVFTTLFLVASTAILILAVTKADTIIIRLIGGLFIMEAILVLLEIIFPGPTIVILTEEEKSEIQEAEFKIKD